MIFTSRLATEDGLKEHLPDLQHHVTLYLGIDCLEEDSMPHPPLAPWSSSKRHTNESLASPSPAKWA